MLAQARPLRINNNITLGLNRHGSNEVDESRPANCDNDPVFPAT